MTRLALMTGLAVAAASVMSPAIDVAAAQATLRPDQMRRVLGSAVSVERVRGARTDTISAVTADGVTLSRGEVLVQLADTTAPVRALEDDSAAADGADKDHLHLFEFMTLDVGNRPRTLAVTAQPQGGGLRFDGQRFVGVVYLGIEDLDHPGDEVEFSPVNLQIFSHADATVPDQVRMNRTGIPSTRVALDAMAPGAHVPLYVWVQGQVGRTEYQVPVLRSRIRVVSTVTRPQGLGLDEVRISVSLPDDVRVESLPVQLSSRTVPVPPELTVHRGRSTSFTIRSKGVGVDTIVVQGPGFLEAGLVGLDFQLPLWFLGAALLGGLVGAVAGRWWTRHRGKAAHARWAELVAGLAGGLVAAVLYVLGVNLTGLPILSSAAEAGVFVVAAVGSMVGLPALLKVVPGGGER